MTKLKALISLLLVVALLFSLTACGNTEGSTSSLTETDDTTGRNANKSFADYAGLWSESDLSWDFGGLTLEFSIKNEEVLFDCRLTQSAPQSRVAQFTQSVTLSEIKDNSIIINYDEDGWGNSGTVEFTFAKDYVLVDFKDIVSNDLAIWGFYESTYKLVRNDNAYKLLEYDMDDYYEKYPDEPSSEDTYTDAPMYTFPSYNTTTPVYDTSKASGILASMGMTEEEFKASCTPLINNQPHYAFFSYFHGYEIGEVLKYTVSYGKEYYENNPDDEDLQEEICDWESGTILSFYKTGEYNYPVCETLEEYLSYTAYPSKGEQLIYEYTENLFEKMREFPNEYVGQCFVFLDVDGYGENSVSITDVRDDTSNPNILFSKYDYYLYVVFTGSKGFTLNFDLIAIEKIREN